MNTTMQSILERFDEKFMEVIEEELGRSYNYANRELKSFLTSEFNSYRTALVEEIVGEMEGIKIGKLDPGLGTALQDDGYNHGIETVIQKLREIQKLQMFYDLIDDQTN